MSDPFSLVIFTLFGQCAAGLMFFLCLRRDTQPCRAWIACIILAIAALASLGHLGTPVKCLGTLTNVGSSWLSREILMCLLFGGSIAAYALLKKQWLGWLSAFLGLVFVYAMSQVYAIATEPAWSTSLTFWNFLAAAVVLGSVLTMLLDEMFPDKKKNSGKVIINWSLITMCAVVLSAILLSCQLPGANAKAAANLITALVLLVIGGGFGLMLLSLTTQRIALVAGNEFVQSSLRIKSCTVAVVCLIFLAEIFARYSFYQGYVWFGM